MRQEPAAKAPAVDEPRSDDADLTIDVGWLLDAVSGFPAAIGRWIAAERVNIAIAVGLTVAAAALRLFYLERAPFGLHGDEAWTGLDARRILDEGWIGPYVPSALGQPSGPLYFTALIFKIFGDSVGSIRLSMALFGVAAIPLTFMACSLMYNRMTGVFAALILLGMTWHLHLSRMGFMVISWPTFEMLSLWALWLAFKRRSAWLYAFAGLCLGLGVYTYNAYLVFVPIPFLAIGMMFFYQPRAQWARHGAMCAIFALTALVAASSLLRWINDNEDQYRAHRQVIGVQYTDAWKAAGLGDRIEILWERGRDWHEGLIYGAPEVGRIDGLPDTGDGLAAPGHPVVAPLLYIFALVGLVFALVRVRRPEYAILIAAVLLLPTGALFTIGAGMYRRTLGLAPFVAILAAIPLARAYAGLWGQPGRIRYLALALFIVPAFAGARATYDYFGSNQETQVMRDLMVQEQHVAAQWMDSLPPETKFYFYSGRWSFNYETRRFDAPDAVGVDRSTQFRQSRSDAPLDFSIDVDGPVAFVFLHPYAGEAEDPNVIDGMGEVRRRYPGGEEVEQRHDGRLMFKAWYLPEGAP